MNLIQIGTYAFGAVQIACGVLGLILGKLDMPSAMAIITSGAAIFGLTKQNVTLGRALGKRYSD